MTKTNTADLLAQLDELIAEECWPDSYWERVTAVQAAPWRYAAQLTGYLPEFREEDRHGLFCTRPMVELIEDIVDTPGYSPLFLDACVNLFGMEELRGCWLCQNKMKKINSAELCEACTIRLRGDIE